MKINPKLYTSNAFMYAKPNQNASGGAGSITWSNLVVRKSNKITYINSTTKYGSAYFHFEENGIYMMTIFIHWNNSTGRHFCDAIIRNNDAILEANLRTTDTQNDGIGDPSTTNTFIIPIKKGTDITIQLYSSTNWTLYSGSYIQIIKIGEIPQLILE